VRIAIDARELIGHPTGVGRFLGEILREWGGMAEASSHEFILCAPLRGPTPYTTRLKVDLQVEPGHGTLWEQRVLPRLAERAQADVLFCPAYSGPIFGATPLVVAIHDVSFAAHPEWFRWREGLRRRIITRAAAHRARRIITISNFSRDEIVEHLGVPGSKIDVVYLAATPVTHSSTSFVAHLSTSGASREPLVLYVGSIFNRRHVPETIRGFARMARRHPEAQLTVVGDNRTFPALDLARVVVETKQETRVHLTSYVSEEVLADLCRRARAFVFLSSYEGFGLTPLEALATGIPIVVLDTPVAREVYGDAAIYVSAPDPRLIEAALDEALFDERARARVLAAAPAILARYSWSECARRVLRVLESAR
jgi:glycosyltransferase involved in cell wall biosynthesis